MCVQVYEKSLKIKNQIKTQSLNLQFFNKKSDKIIKNDCCSCRYTYTVTLLQTPIKPASIRSIFLQY